MNLFISRYLKWPELLLILFYNIAVIKNIFPRILSFDTTIALISMSVFGFFVFHYKSLKSIIISTKIYFLILWFILILLVSIFHTPDLGVALDKYMRFIVLTIVPFFIVLFFLKDIKSIFYCYTVFIIINLLFAIIAIYLNYNTILSGELFRLAIFKGSPIGFATQMGISFFLALSLMKFKDKKQIALKIAVLFALLIGLLLSNSKGPLLSLVLCMIVYILLIYDKPIPKKITIFLLFCLTVLGVFMILPESVTFRYTSIFHSEDILSVSSLHTRIFLQKKAMEFFLQHPIVGIGLGGFESIFGKGMYPHNIFLELLAETGILGILPFLFLLIIIFKKGIELVKFPLDDDQKSLARGTFIALLYLILAKQVSGNLNELRLFFFFAGILILIFHFRTETTVIENHS